MPEHLIRLRGGWQFHDPGAATTEPTPLTLPVDWGLRTASRRLLLTRKFGRPGTGRLQLVLEAVEGLRVMTLNGEPLRFDSSSRGRLVVDLPPLRERNVLVLDVEIEGPSNEPHAPWGSIGLAIHE